MELKYYENTTEYDFIVVGGGSAGVAVARRLSDNPKQRVLLLEAGPDEPTVVTVPVFAFRANNTQYDWQYKTTPQKRACLSTNGECIWPRGKMLCGTACLSGHMYSRGSPAIYNQWGANNPGWNFKDIIYYFKKSENNVEPKSEIETEYHGFDGPLYVGQLPNIPDFARTIQNAGNELGIYINKDVNGHRQDGFTVAPIMVKDGLMMSPSKAFIRPVVQNRKNLHVLLQSTVSKVILNESKNRAVGVEFRDKFGRLHVVNATKEVILSAGVVGSPQILMLSGIGPADHLKTLNITVHHDLPVGENLHHHIGLSVGVHVSVPNTYSFTLDSLEEYIEKRTGIFASNGMTQVTAFLISKYETLNKVPDTQIFIDGYSGGCYDVKSYSEDTLLNFRPVFLRSECRGSVKLKSNNVSDAPLINPNYLCDEKDTNVLLEAVKLIRNLTKTTTLSKYIMKWNVNQNNNCKKYQEDDDKYWLCVLEEYTNGENHHGGTCKMGPKSDPKSVVDHELRIHGISNLRVADGSIFPTPVNCNPIAPTIMVGEKAADMINNVWNKYV